MPPLMAIIGANADPMRRELREVERMTARAGASIKSNMAAGSGHNGSSGIIRETIVLMREMSRGNWTRVPGSLSILVQRLGILKYAVTDNVLAANVYADALENQSVAATAAALASKAQADANMAALSSMDSVSAGTLLAVAADREKAAADLAVANAERVKAIAARQAAVAMEAEGVATRFALGPLGWAAIALIAVGTAAYFTVRHFSNLRETTNNLNEVMNLSQDKFTQQAEALKNATEHAQAFDDWLANLSDSQETLAEKTEIALKALREQGKYEKELAEKKGMSGKDSAKMDIEQLQKEVNLVTAAKLEARRKLEQDKIEAQKAEDNAANPYWKKQGDKIGGKTKQMVEIADAIQEAMQSAVRYEIDAEASRTSAAAGGTGAIYKKVDASADEKFQVKVGGKEYLMSLNEAKANFDGLAKEEAHLAKIQKELADILEKKKKLTEKDLADYNRLSKEAKELQSDLDIKSKYLPQLTKEKFPHGSVNALQAVGAYASPATAIDIAKKQLHELKGIHDAIKKGGGGPGGLSGQPKGF